MGFDANKALIRRVFEEVFNQAKHELADELYHTECSFHGVPHGFEERRGPSVVKDLSSAYHRAFPDQHYEIEAMLAEGDTVAVRWRVSATHQDTLDLGPLSLLKTGRRVDVRGFSMCRIADGQITDVWQVVDMLTAFQQMGADAAAGAQPTD